MATPDQVAELERKIKSLNIPEEDTEKWLTKAGVEAFDEMTADTVAKCIAYCDKKIKEATTPANKESD
jgi:hypothetical protein